MSLIGFPFVPLASGAAPWSPTDLGVKLRAWWDYTDTANLWQNTDATGAVSSDTDPVGRVSDKSGNGKHLIQATGGNKPAYRTGSARVRFDGTNDHLACASAAFPIDVFELYQVFEQHASGSNDACLYSFAPASGNDWNQSSAMLCHLGLGTELFRFESNSSSLNCIKSGSGLAPLAVYEARKTASTSEILTNGTSNATDNSFTASSSPHAGSFLDCARFLSGAVAAQYGPVDRRETVMTAELTSDERTSLRNYLYAKHGITP